VKRFASLIPKHGTVLDLACGSGRHAYYLAEAGFIVTAIDRDMSQFKSSQLPLIATLELDLELDTWPLKDQLFDGIVVTNYLYRPHLDQLPKMLANGGVLIYETFAQGNEAFGKPSNPNFLLKTGELLNLAQRHGLKVVAYEDLYQDDPKPAMIQRICAVKEV
jgi:SAM-dependent methyltransferase